jgi:cytochrome oxidase assembly protein ShyY1
MAIRFNNWIFTPRLIPSVVFVLLMILLLSLGNWQLGRSVEKQISFMIVLLKVKQASWC